MIKIILLDVDGVLVYPGGYRAALRATFNHFIYPTLEIDEGTLTEMERRGIASEWDMAPLLLAAYWNDILSRQPIQNLPTEVFSAGTVINRQRNVDAPARLFVPEFALVAGQYPAETAFRAGCFPSIPYDLRKNLLTETRNVYKSHTMRIFQHFTLGSEKFKGTYDLAEELSTKSFLLTHDRPIIDDKINRKLRRSNYRLAAFTSRPSAPPRDVDTSNFGYAPEAELALELVGLPDIPLIGYGRLTYLAKQRGVDTATLLKPSPVQALAAIAAAFTGEEWTTIQAAADWQKTGQLNGVFSRLPRSFELIVVEDTIGGINSTLKAAEILQQAGMDITVQTLGLTSGSSSKAAAFQQAGIPFYEDWGSLMDQIEKGSSD
jgi:phosphoglycolate phosphatase-like HAD superfamily hydrolase